MTGSRPLPGAGGILAGGLGLLGAAREIALLGVDPAVTRHLPDPIQPPRQAAA
ncbi:hypothetical protein [Luteipulveratus flavus]|uniref:Uncharacterized protein n=1 Tax=Luteipulveratus flavus TaxID=3031728 RepID=A0ABT6C7I7_9MICO|nr:hypothetical protein [Luteipulveratus sp. YIM 133296]MDF8264845.1 hypothetical protein [Luteipulveratus sp. YIM 133296]